MPAVSVIIPTHNRLDFLCEAVDSVLRQTFRDFELIVVDDGSSDRTSEEIPDRYPFVRLIRQEHAGVSRARNRGAGSAAGEWIAFLDSDDLWVERKLSLQWEGLQRTKNHLICYTDEIWYRRGRRVNPGRRHRKHSGDVFLPSLSLCIVSPSSVLLKRELFEEVGGFDETLPVCEDYDLWLRIAAKEPFLFLPEPLIIKRNGHPDQLSQTTWGMDRFRIASLAKLLESGTLTSDQRRAALNELERKGKVYAAGCLKRGRTEEAERIARHLLHLREKTEFSSCPFHPGGKKEEPKGPYEWAIDGN